MYRSQYPNPFAKEEPLQFWFTEDADYQLSRKRSLNYCFQYLNRMSPTTSTIQNTYQNLIHWVARHTVAAAIIAFIVTTSITAAAFEALAPKNLKPSTFIESLSGINEIEPQKEVEGKLMLNTSLDDSRNQNIPVSSQPQTKFVKAVEDQPGFNGVNVRNTPCGDQIIGTIGWGIFGEINPNSKAIEATCFGETYTWYYVKWINEIEGWTIAENLDFIEKKPVLLYVTDPAFPELKIPYYDFMEVEIIGTQEENLLQPENHKKFILSWEESEIILETSLEVGSLYLIQCFTQTANIVDTYTRVIDFKDWVSDTPQRASLSGTRALYYHSDYVIYPEEFDSKIQDLFGPTPFTILVDAQEVTTYQEFTSLTPRACIGGFADLGRTRTLYDQYSYAGIEAYIVNPDLSTTQMFESLAGNIKGVVSQDMLNQ